MLSYDDYNDISEYEIPVNAMGGRQQIKIRKNRHNIIQNNATEWRELAVVLCSL